MKRKMTPIGLVVLCVVVISFLCIIGVYAMNGGNIFSEIFKTGDGFVEDGSLLSIIDKANSASTDKQNAKQSANKLITKVYRSEDFGFLGTTKNGQILDMSSSPRSLYAVNEAFPIECLRKVNDDLVYAVYKLKDNNGPQYFMYCFFSKLDPVREGAKEGTELWWLTGRVMYAKKPLSNKSFDSMKVGSTISDVAAIDPMTDIYKPNEAVPFKNQKYDEKLGKYVEYTEAPLPILTYTAYHYLKDGILCIVYTRNDEKSEFTVSSIGFNDTFDMPSDIKKGSVELKIQSEDYPEE